MRIAVVAALVVPIAACGDNLEPEAPDATTTPRCEPAQGPLPMEGVFADPLALPLPASCVVGGLRDLPGRWFVADPEANFQFEYPKFEGDCDAGFKKSFYFDEDHDISDDGFTFHTWSDGTRIYLRYNFRFEMIPQPPFEFANAFAACLLPDGTMAAVEANFDTDRGERVAAMTGKRFGLKDDPASGLTLVGSVVASGPETTIVGYNVVVDGNHAYVVGPNGLDVVDVTDPATPTHVGHFEGSFNDVRVVRGGGKVVAFVSPIRDELTTVVDVTNPAAPTFVSNLPEYSHSLHVVVGPLVTHLYLATYTDVVPRYDVTNPLVPVRLGATKVPGELAGVHDLYVEGDRIYANNTTAGLVAFDVSAGLATPVEVGRIASPYSHASWVGIAGGRQIVLHGDEGMTKSADGGAFLRVLDGDPASPTYMKDIGRYQSRPEVGIHNFQLVGDKLYISYYQDGVRVVDLSTPTLPREIAHFNTWDPQTAQGAAFEGAVGIRVAGGLLYVADIDRGLLILREQ